MFLREGDYKLFLYTSNSKFTTIIWISDEKINVSRHFVSSNQKMIYKQLNTSKAKQSGTQLYVQHKLRKGLRGRSYLSFWKGLDIKLKLVKSIRWDDMLEKAMIFLNYQAYNYHLLVDEQANISTHLQAQIKIWSTENI